MHQHPVSGIMGSKANVPPNGKARLSSRPGARIATLSEEYLQMRNAKLRAQSFLAQVQADQRRGELIRKYDAKVALGFLLTGMRQRLMSFAYALPRQLEGKNQHEIGRIIDAEVRSALKDIASWPGKMADPGWCHQIDADLVPVEPEGNGGGNAEGAAELERRNSKRRRKYAASKE